jgi:hypothetical protein
MGKIRKKMKKKTEIGQKGMSTLRVTSPVTLDQS